MSERCFVKVKWDPATTGQGVRRAVGGFLRYIQHRDLHQDSKPALQPAKVGGLLKYVAYRDRAASRAELFSPEGRAGTAERKAFAEHVARSIEESRPQMFRARDGRWLDRRRSVSRAIVSPERADGLDLERLLRAGVARLEAEMGLSGLRWIAAIHRNTDHHHFHLVLAGMHRDAQGAFHRVDITKRRLAAIKEAFRLEIERQRGERGLIEQTVRRTSSAFIGGNNSREPALTPLVFAPGLIRTPPMTAPAPGAASGPDERGSHADLALSILRLRAVARRYQRQMQQDADAQARRLRWERAA
jgi:hypothetical protein